MTTGTYSFLLIDDEEIIRNGISGSIYWSREGFDFLPPCADGEEALRVIDEKKPDVILTDICMPKVDGLEIAKYAAAHHPDALVLILSGYDDFEYARQAIRYNVFEYVLKPISSRTLRELLQRIRDELDRRSSFQLDYERLLGEVERSRQIILERFLYRLVGGEPAEEEIAAYARYLPFDGECLWFSSICFDLDDARTVSNRDFSPDLYMAALTETVRSLSGGGKSVVFQTPDRKLVIVLGARHALLCEQKGRQLSEQIHAAAARIPVFTVSAGIGRAKQGIGNVHTSYGEALSALEYRLIAGKNSIITYPVKASALAEDDMRFSGFPDAIKKSLRMGSFETSGAVVLQFCAALKRSTRPMAMIRIEIGKFVFAVIEVLDDLGFTEEATGGAAIVERLADVPGLQDLDRIHEELDRVLTAVAAYLKEKKKRFPEQKAFEIRKYLDEHYADVALSVENVSLLFFVSPSYLYRLFRQYVGKSFVEYLTDVRMEAACRLLRTTAGKTFEIAAMVGYEDPGYFSSCFKKHTGKTPSEYRDSL